MYVSKTTFIWQLIYQQRHIEFILCKRALQHQHSTQPSITKSCKDKILMVKVRERGMQCKNVANHVKTTSSTMSTCLKK